MRCFMCVLRQGDSYAAKWADIIVNQINQLPSDDIIACTGRKGKYFKFNGFVQLGEEGADMTKEQRKELLEKQLALLSELSQKADPSMVCDMTGAMIALVEVMNDLDDRTDKKKVGR